MIAGLVPALTSQEQRRAVVASERTVAKIHELTTGRNLVSVTPTGEKKNKARLRRDLAPSYA
ncbi:MAG: hypothetical protein ACREBZ_06150, partial [Thermoplasmata archaeon]